MESPNESIDLASDTNEEVTEESPEDVEFEDLDVSDTDIIESEMKELEFDQINIDYNSRIITKSPNFFVEDNPSVHFHSHDDIKLIPNNEEAYTDDEHLDVSDDDSSHQACAKRNINLKNVSGAGKYHQAQNLSTILYSGGKKDETDEEDVTDEEGDASLIKETRYEKLIANRGVTNIVSAIKKASSSVLPTLSLPLNFLNAVNEGSYLESPLLPTSELADDPEDEHTDTEDLDLDPEAANPRRPSDLDITKGNLSVASKLNAISPSTISSNVSYAKQPSYNASLRDNEQKDHSSGTEDETVYVDNLSSVSLRRRVKKRNRKRGSINQLTNDSSTDEEVIYIANKEWTETDESGGIRQVTHIKTETSIKLDGDGAVRSLKKVPKKEPSEERKRSTDSEQEDLSFTEKKSFFQRLSLTSDTLPTSAKWTQDVSLDDLPMAEGEIVTEQINFEDRLKMFEPDEGNRKKIQKRDKNEQPTVYRYDFTKPKDKSLPTEYVVSELEKAEEIVKQVNAELSIEEQRLSDPNFGLLEKDQQSEHDSLFTLEKVEQEVSSLLAEVDKEEKEFSDDLQHVPYSRTDSDRSNNVSSFIFDMDSDKGNNYIVTSPDELKKAANIMSPSSDVSNQDDVNILELETSSLASDRVVADQNVKVETPMSEFHTEGEGAAVDGDDVISRTTSTTTTRVVTTVRTGEDGVDGQEATEDGDDLRHSVEVILNQFMTDDGKPADPKHDE